MRPEKLLSFLTSSIKAGRRILIKGMPGIGKTDITANACGGLFPLVALNALVAEFDEATRYQYDCVTDRVMLVTAAPLT